MSSNLGTTGRTCNASANVAHNVSIRSINRNSNKRNRRGVVLYYTTVVMLLMCGFCSFAVDYGRVQLAKTQLRGAADAAALYGAAGIWQGTNEVRSRIVQSGAENTVDGKSLSINATQDIEFGNWDPSTKSFSVLSGFGIDDANAIRVTARRTAARGNAIPTLFAAVLGQKTCDVTATSIAGLSGAMDVMLVQDVTRSFAEEIDDARAGDKVLVESLYQKGLSRSKVGVVAFTGWGKTLLGLTPIKTNYSQIQNTVNTIALAGSTNMPPASGTDIATGLDEALKNFKSSSYVPSGGGKAVVLVSDGEPNQDSGGAHPSMNDAQLLKLAQDKADDLWKEKVSVYVVFFNRDNSITAANQLRSLTRGHGYFVQVTDPNKLPAALAALSTRLPVSLLK